MKIEPVYNVSKLTQSIKIDGDWNKKQWQNINSVDIINYMGQIPEFRPVVKAKMMYDDQNLYVIFQVQDRYVRCLTNSINGPVWEDSCVEFFFSPDQNLPERYFNIEINCGGTPLMHYNIIPDLNIIKLAADDIKLIGIAHSLPQHFDPEITSPVTWAVVNHTIPNFHLPQFFGLLKFQ